MGIVIARNPSGPGAAYPGWRFIIAFGVARLILEFVVRSVEDRIERRNIAAEIKRLAQQREYEKQALDDLTRKGIRPPQREDNAK